MKNLLKILGLGTVLTASALVSGCGNRELTEPQRIDYVIRNILEVSGARGEKLVVRNVDGQLGFDIMETKTREGNPTFPKYITKEYSEKTGEKINGKLIRELTPEMQSAILEQKSGIQNLSYALADQEYNTFKSQKQKESKQ